MKLPPLNALRMFDAVARLGGIRPAAEALFVTPAAVTQQVKQLEQAIGTALLARAGRGVVLTDAGRRLHAGTTPQLRAIAETADQLRPRPRRVRVTAAPSFAVRWLVPRLQRFLDRYPGADVRIEAASRLADPAGPDWDVAMRLGHGHYPGTESAPLFAYDVVPVCAPAYAKRLFGVADCVLQPTDATCWAKARLLHETCHSCWPGWLQRAGIRDADSAGGLHFSHLTLAIAAALEGQGIALVPPSYVEAELAAQSLVMLDARPYQTGVGLHAVWPSGRELTEPARQFRDWVLVEAAAASNGAADPAAQRPQRGASFV